MRLQGRILVAEDDPEMLGTISDTLGRSGAVVLRAMNGVELFERLANDGPFDLIITDIAMPWVSGLQAMHSARTAGLLAPVLVITGLEDGRIVEQARALGRDALLLRKPFDAADLEAAVGKLMGADRTQGVLVD